MDKVTHGEGAGRQNQRPSMIGFQPGDLVRVLQDRASVVTSFDQSDAAWEEDMGAYLGQTGIVLEADEVVAPSVFCACVGRVP